MRQSLADVTNLVNKEQTKLISLRLRNDALKVQSAPQHQNSLAQSRMLCVTRVTTQTP